jgi:hypothetical protein
VGGGWQLSAGDISELVRPLFFALAALASAWVLSDSLRRGLTRPAVAAWTLATLLLPFVLFPLYLAARLYTRRPAPAESSDEQTREESAMAESASRTDADVAGPSVEAEAVEASGGGIVRPKPERRRTRRGLIPPLAYAAALATCGAAYFWHDRRTFDAHFARAKRANLYGRRDETIREYRAALRLRDDAHTRKLLGLELLEAARHEEALAEFLAAEAAGDADEALPFHKARSLDALSRRAEAVEAYRAFAGGFLCADAPEDRRCAAARARLERP